MAIARLTTRTILALAVSALFLGCSMPSMRVTLSAETGEATTGRYSLQREGTTYAAGSSASTFADALSTDLVLPSPSPSPFAP